MACLVSRVVGVTFVDPDGVKRARLVGLVREAEWHNQDRRPGEGLAVVLRRNPENPYDGNAVEVHVPALGDDGFLGHLPREAAARVAAVMDAGVAVVAEVCGVRVMPGAEHNPGIDVRVTR